MVKSICNTLAAFVSLGMASLSAHAAGSGAVFVMTNAADHNQVIAYERNPGGRLQQRAIYDTEGRGSGGVTDPLQSQGSLTLSPDHSILYAVNAGSGTVSSFEVQGPTLAFVGHTPSGGSEPVAVTQFGKWVYVLNGGASGDVVVFEVNTAGRLKQVPNSTAFLSGNYTGGASISVRPDGKFLAVVERQANKISTFPINTNGTLGKIVTTDSAVPGAFSGEFAPNGTLLVTDNTPGSGYASAFSSYQIAGTGSISAVSQSVPTYGNGNCWSALTPNGQYAYTQNSASSTISGFFLNANGTLQPVKSTIVATLPQGSINLDASVTADGKFLYTLNSGTGTIGIFGVNSDGTLTEIGEQRGLEASSGYQGLAAL